MGVVAGRSNRRTDGATDADDRSGRSRNQGLGDIQIHPKLRFLNATRRGLGFADHAVGHPAAPATRTRSSARGRRSSSRWRSSTPSSATSAASAPRSTPACASARGRRRTSTTRRSFTTPPHVQRRRASPPAGHRGQERGHRRPRPVVRHRAAEVRPRRRALRQLRPRLAPDRDAGAPATTMKPSAEAIGAIKLYLARNSFFELGGGCGLLPNGYGATRTPRAFIGFIFEPSIGDRDGDGIKDDVDKCPDDPEDFDDFEDEDGCPDPDNDKRRHPRRRRQVPERARDQERLPGRGRLPRRARRSIATATASPTTSTSARTIPRTRTASRTRTAAPIPTTTRTASSTSTTCARTTPRTRTASRTRTAAPIPTTTRTASSTWTTSARTSRRPTTASRTRTAAPTRAASSCRKGKLEILDKIYFETDKAIIKPISFPILDAVAATLKGNPQIQLDRDPGPRRRARRRRPQPAT